MTQIKVMKHSSLKMCFWNIGGLISKNQNKTLDPIFIKEIESFDLVFLAETHIGPDTCINKIGPFKFHLVCRKMTKSNRRFFGGLAILYKEGIKNHIKILPNSNPDYQWIKLEKTFFGFQKDLYICLAYFPPSMSSYTQKLEFDLLDCIEKDIVGFQDKGNILLCGDFNARVGSQCDFILHDDNNYLPIFNTYHVDKQILQRRSYDVKLDTRGKDLLDLCVSQQLRFLNGRTLGDLSGKFTCYKPVGASVVDYAIMSESALEQVLYFKVNNFIPTLSDCHSKIEWKISALYTTTCTQNVKEHSVFPMSCNYIWSDDSSEKFQTVLSSTDIQDLIHKFENDVINNSHNDINDAAVRFSDILIMAADKSLRKPNRSHKTRAKNKHEHNNWFDIDLKKMRYNLINYGKIYSKFPKDPFVRNHFYKLNREYTKARKTKKKKYKDSVLKELEDLNENNPKLYWKLINDLKNKKGETENNISSTQWCDHFQDLNSLNPAFSDRLKTLEEKLEAAEKVKCFNELDLPINISEISLAINKLKNNKAPGLDNITNNMLKCGHSFLINCLKKMFNSCLSSGLYPTVWAEGYIKPLFKNGNSDDPNNYRGLTITSCIGKLFNSILNSRLDKFLLNNKLIDDSQIGFTKKARTSDHMFVLKCIVDKYCSHKDGRVFACFVDLRKAFDTVIHTGLKLKLLDIGVGSRFYNVIKNMYSISKTCINIGKGSRSDFFPNNLGVKQGDNLSPNLFKIFINDLPKYLKHTSSPVVLNSHSVNCLMYADDIVLLSLSSNGLQEKIDMLAKFCKDWCLTVNLSKTKIVIFNKAGRHLKYNFTYDKNNVECVSKCKYLGITFCSSGSFSYAQNELYQKGLKAYFKLCKDFISLNPSPKISLHVFDHTLLPILLYGCEIWGYFNPFTTRFKRKPDLSFDEIYNRLQCESLHVKFCKFILGCGRKSTNFATLSELGRFSLHFNIIKSMLKFWHRLENLQNQFPILKDAYLTSMNLFQNKIPSWYGSVHILMKSVFDKQDSSKLVSMSTNCFKTLCNKVTKTHYTQLWHKQKSSLLNGKLCTYFKFKHNMGYENYLTVIKNFEHRRRFTRFRISAHRLRIEVGRYQGILRQDRFCQNCSSGEVEDEIHFLFECDKFKELRANYIDTINNICSNFNNLQNTEKLIWIMNNENIEILSKLCGYIMQHSEHNSPP